MERLQIVAARAWLLLAVAAPSLAAAQDTADDSAKLRSIQFGPGMSRLSAGSQELEAVSAFLAAHPDVTKLRIAGHANNTGPAKKALALSGRRALAVKDALIALGVDGGRLFAVAFGRDRPIADNATPAGRALNERVELEIAERKGQPSGDVTGGGQLVTAPPPAGVVDEHGGHTGADGFYYDRFGGYYDDLGGYQFKDGSYRSRCSDRYDAATGKFLTSTNTEFVPPANVRSGSLAEKRSYLQDVCLASEVIRKDDEERARKRHK
jgi:OmpA family